MERQKKHGRMARSWWKQMKKKSGNVGMSGMWNLKSGISGMSMNFSNKKRDGGLSSTQSKYVKICQKCWRNEASIINSIRSFQSTKTSVNPWLPPLTISRKNFHVEPARELGIENKVLSTREIGCALKKSLNHGVIKCPPLNITQAWMVYGSIMATFSGDVQYTQNGTVTNPR